MNKFLSVLKTIGDDVEKGIQVAAPVVGEFVPAVGPILGEIAYIIQVLEASGKSFTPEQLSTMIQTLTAAHVIKQSATENKTLTPILAKSPS